MFFICSVILLDARELELTKKLSPVEKKLLALGPDPDLRLIAIIDGELTNDECKLLLRKLVNVNDDFREKNRKGLDPKPQNNSPEIVYGALYTRLILNDDAHWALTHYYKSYYGVDMIEPKNKENKIDLSCIPRFKRGDNIHTSSDVLAHIEYFWMKKDRKGFDKWKNLYSKQYPQ